MSKKQVPPDFMSSFLKSGGKAPEPEETPNLDPGEKEPLRQRQIRMSDSDWNRLRECFERKGISISSGIRMIIREYLAREEM
jgi:hypothetical protein